MTPTKVKDLVPELAVRIGIPEEDLASMYSFYFKEIKLTAAKLQHCHLILRGLGSLNLQGWKLQDKIDECKEEQKDPALFVAALEKWKQEKALKKATGIKKRQFYDNKNINNEPERDITNSLEE
jgi:hypothetical protein